MFRIIDELDTLIRTFNHDKIEFALCGAIAMAIHGYPRAAMDIDLLVEEQVLDQIQRIADENGFVSLELGALIDAGIRRRSKITGGVILGLDLLLVGDETKDVLGIEEAGHVSGPSDVCCLAQGLDQTETPKWSTSRSGRYLQNGE